MESARSKDKHNHNAALAGVSGNESSCESNL